MDIPAPEQDPRYTKLISELRTVHGEIRQKDYNNPAYMVEMKDDLGKLRLGANLLFSFLNKYIDILTTLQEDVAKKRQQIYVETLKEKTAGVAETHSRNMTRIDESQVRTIELRIQQIKNEYERYNSIAMYLQSRLKETQSERAMG